MDINNLELQQDIALVQNYPTLPPQNKKRVLGIIAGIVLMIILITGGIFVFRAKKVPKENPHTGIVMQPSPSPLITPPVRHFTYAESVENGMIKPIGKVLLINLFYDEHATTTLSITKIVKANGYVPGNAPTSGDKLVLVDAKNHVLYTTYFLIPNHIEDPPPLPGETVIGDGKDFTTVPFSLTIPFLPSVVSIQLLDSTNKLLATQVLNDSIPSIDNKPNFLTVQGVDTLKENKQSFLLKLKNLIFHKAIAANNDGHFDIAIIADAYTDMNAFHADADAIAHNALRFEPLHTRASQISVHYIDNTTELGCSYDSAIVRLLACDQQKVIQQVTIAGAPYDGIYVLVNNSTYGGSGGYPVAAGYNGTYKGQMFVHEFIGHNFGDLRDEYFRTTGDVGVGAGSVVDGQIDNSAHSLHGTDGNCYAGVPPIAAWDSVGNPADFRLGCSFQNWYRSSPTSVMADLTVDYFNPVSQAVLNRRLDAVAGPFTSSDPVPTIVPFGTIQGWKRLASDTKSSVTNSLPVSLNSGIPTTANPYYFQDFDLIGSSQTVSVPQLSGYSVSSQIDVGSIITQGNTVTIPNTVIASAPNHMINLTWTYKVVSPTSNDTIPTSTTIPPTITGTAPAPPPPNPTTPPCNLPLYMQTELGCIPTNPTGFVQKYYSVGLGLIGGVAVLFIIFGGYIMMMSEGNPHKVNEGKSYIVYAIVGLLLAIFGYVFIQVIIVDILHIPGFS